MTVLYLRKIITKLLYIIMINTGWTTKERTTLDVGIIECDSVTNDTL